MRRAWSRGLHEAGANALEWVGITIIVAGVVVGLAAVLPTPLSDGLKAAICKVVNGGDASKCSSSQDEKYKPTCTTQLSSDSYGGKIEVAFFSVGRDYQFMRTTSYDPQTGEKTVSITGIKGASAGVGTGIGAGANFGVGNIGADLSGDAKLRLGMGDGWEYKGKDADAKADKLMGDLKEQYSIDAVKENGGLLGRVGGEIYDAAAGPDLPDPDVNRYEGEIDLSGSLSAGLTLGPKDPSGKHRKPDRFYQGKHRKETRLDKLNKHDKRGSDSLDPNFNGSVGVDGNEKAIYETKKNGESSMTVMLKGEVNYGASTLVPLAQGRRQATGAMKISKDKNGKMSSVTLTQTHIVDGHATVITTELPTKTDQERAIVAESLLDPTNKGGPGGQTLALTWDDMAPTKAPGRAASAMDQLLYKNAKTSRVGYAYDQSDAAYGANVKLGLKLGVGAEISNSDRRATDAEYLGAPKPDGSRGFLKYPECRG